MPRSYLIAAIVMAACAPAIAAPFTVDDLLALETIGPTVTDPAGRWTVLSSTRPWNTAPDFGLGNQTAQALGRLDVVDARGSRPLFREDPAVGYVPGPASADGSWMIVHRVRDRGRRLGVVSPLNGQAKFFDVHTEPSVWGRSVQWRSPTQVVAIDRAPLSPSRRLGFGWQPQVRLQQAWGRTWQGKLSVTPLGAGRYLGVRPAAPPDELVLVDVRTGVRQPLARGEFIDFEISADGRWVAALREAEDIQPRADEAVVNGMTNRRRRLVLIDLSARTVIEPFPDQDMMTGLLAWSPSGKSLLIYGRPDARPWEGGALLRFDTTTRSSRRLGFGSFSPLLVPTASQASSVTAGWLGEDIVLHTTRPGEGPSWVRLTPTGPETLRVAGAAPERRPLSWTTDALVLAAQGRSATFVADRIYPQARVSTDDTEPGARLMEAPAHRISSLRGGPPAPDTVSDRRDGHGVLRRVVQTGRGERVARTLNAHLAHRDFSHPLELEHRTSEGRALKSWVYLPAGAPPQGGFPLIIIPYPGTVHAQPPAAYGPGVLKFETNVQLMTAAGYAVLAPSLPLERGEPSDGLAARILAIADAAADRWPVSPSSLILWGQSYGGWAVLMAATQSDRFTAIIATAPIPNLVTRYGALPPQISVVPERGLPIGSALAWAETGQGAMGAPVWAAPERYVRNSPALLSNRIQAPVLVVYGDMDRDPNEAMGLFAGLYRQGKDALLLTYRGEGHVISTPANVRDLYGRAFAFIRDALAGSSPPAGGARPSPTPPRAAP